MTITEILTRLRKLNVSLTVNDGQIVVNGPKGALTESLRAELTERKAEIFAFLQKTADARAIPGESRIQRTSRAEDLPLSFAQQRLWFLDQLEPGRSVYNVPGALRIKGPLVIDVLVSSLNDIVRRHEALRTTFSIVNEEPVQVIASSLSVSLPVIDISRLGEREREEEAARLAAEELGKPFDLRRGPVFRTALLRLDNYDHVLVLTLHHIVSDGWSMGVLYRELSALYRAFAKGEASPLAELPIQYADFAVWQRDWLCGEVLESQLSYWKRQLDGAPAVLKFPTDRPRPAQLSYRGSRQSFEFSSELTQQLKALSLKEGVTLYMSLLAAFQILLHRYTGQDDIMVGSPIANRNRVEIEGLIGFFVNTLVLRTDHIGDPTFRELLNRVKETALQAYEHQDLPFEKLVEELRPDRDLGRSPLFQVMFVLQNAPARELSFEGLRVNPFRIANDTTKFDLTLTMHETAERMRASLQYNTDLFEASTIERMLSHFQVLLEGIVADPGRRTSELPLLTEAEKHQLLVEYNNGARNCPPDKCINELFEGQVERTPEAVAVQFEELRLTYRELNERANRVAQRLQSLGVGPGSLVGLCVERSIELVVGILGILKAGGAYVPLDPSYPKERLEFMVQDSKVSVSLTQKHLLPQLPENESAVNYLAIEDLNNSFDGAKNETKVESDSEPSDLAYVIYTSGSTGQPKGVMITHANVTRLFDSTRAWFEFNGTDVWTLFHSYAFDFSVWEMWGALLNGGKLLIVPQTVSRSPEEFAVFVKENHVTVLNQTPSAFRQLMPYLISTLAPEQSALRYIIFGGETLELKSLQPWFDRYGDGPTQLINMYGITETTVHVTYRPITRADTQSGVGSLIGRPIPDLSLYVLDSHQQPQPIGIPGEIWVGGAGVARGYLNRPELTAERFVSDPFSNDPHAKLYRSGDLARWLPNGELEYLGRIDDQVKIRGYRIELGEIEATLGQLPSIQDSVVLAREDSPGDQRLVAYIVAVPGSTPSTNELRSFLQQKLPAYMVPSVLVFLESLPLTPNGKLNRDALPAPERIRPELDQAFSVPRTPVEELLANIWAEVLKLEKVGIDDNFFDLGGHSLLATQVVARIRSAFNVELPLRRLFESPTINGLATIIETERRTSQTHQLPPIQPASRSGDLPLSFAQQRLWFIDQLEPESSAYNVAGAWRLTGPLDLMALQRSLNEIIRRHEVLRTSFVAVDGEPIQHIQPFMTLPLGCIQLTQLGDSEKESVIRLHAKEEFQKPFDLARGPLLRAKLLRLAEDDHVLLLTMHHIVSDGWSVGVLFRELSQLYEAFAGGNASPLEDLPVQYADYAVWQRGWLQGDVLEAQLAYWRRQLENLTILQLPTDRQRPMVLRYRGAKARVHFDAALTKKLWALSRGENATLYITLLAAFQVLLSRYSGQENIAVGSPIAGRSIPELEGLIGFFANTLVLRGDLSGDPTFREFLSRMRDVALEAYAHQDVPFEKLVEDLSPRRELNISPLFQAMFVLQNDPRENLELKGLSVRSLSVSSETAKFDILLSLRENQLGLIGTLEYDTDLFDSTTIERMVGQFETLLNGIVANPDQRILKLPLLPDAERHQLIVEWNDTKKQYSEHLCVHQLFEHQAKKTPDRVAVVFKGRQMSYRDLDLRSNQLARYLRKKGIEAESLVGVCLERSPEMIVALLAVLKAGAAYLPLDPFYPPERLKLMLEQAGTSSVLTRSDLVSRIPVTAACYCLDTLDPILAQENQESSNCESFPTNAAYVLFTSGSTGVPKGVLMEHRSLVNLLSWQVGVFTAPVDARTLQFAPLSFDVSFQEIFSTLCTGGTLVMIGELERRDPKALLSVLEEKAVERIFLPFVALQQLADAAQADEVAVKSLREVITAGEQLQATQPILELFTRLPNCRLHNQYGPTESHVVSACCLASDPADWPNLPPIGRPIANAEIYILDLHLNPVPIGVAGEIYIGGDGLARGYVNQPELTAEKFITHSFDREVGKRLYKTGDLARYLPDGKIEFLGRVDNQVKIRGFRIEPGEIETLVCRHAEVVECVVAACGNDVREQTLVAYIVTSAAQHRNSGMLRDFLKEKLPEYMIPNVFVFLDSLPRTASGKIDRRGLPVPDGTRPELTETYVGPRTSIEKSITQIWKEILKLERVGIHDNFFELGGHSLLATQVMSRIRSHFSIELPLRNLFESPTVAEMANIIELNRTSEVDPQALERLVI